MRIIQACCAILPPSPATATRQKTSSRRHTVTTDSVIVKGTVADNKGVTELTVNGEAVTLNPDGSYAHEVALSSSTTTVTITAKDAAGNTTTKTLTITR